MKRKHDATMFAIGLIFSLGVAADAASAWQTRTAELSIGATVVRPLAPPTIALRGGAVLVTHPAGSVLSVEGGALRRQADGAIRVEGVAGAVAPCLLYTSPSPRDS